MKASIETIARDHLHIPTLETQNRDGLDFHDVAVWGVKAALEEAYRQGLQDQADLLSCEREPYAWGYTIGSVIETMKTNDFSQHEASAALLSIGIEHNVKTLKSFYENNDIQPASLTDKQLRELRYRANLYSQKAGQ